MIGNVGGNPTTNTLFNTVNAIDDLTLPSSGWYLSIASTKTLSGTHLFVARQT
jgi:hypothetical protein